MMLFSQIADPLWRLWAYATQPRLLAVFIGIGFALLAIALLIASRTRWGQAKPLTKCIALSVLAHVWLLMYALGTRAILPQGDLNGREQNMSVSFESDPSALAAPAVDQVPSDESNVGDASREPLPWERPLPLADLPKPPELEALMAQSNLSAPDLLPPPEPTPMPALPPPALWIDPSIQEVAAEKSSSQDSTASSRSDVASAKAEGIAASAIEGAESYDSTNERTSVDGVPTIPAKSVASTDSPVLPPRMDLSDNSRLPTEYQLRQASNRLELSTPFGADADSEAAVEAGLQWLAAAQSEDGSWNAKRFGAGTETMALGESRYGTGDKADTGVSGLALLAFLSAGHTHLEGDYKGTVQHGLEYLLRAQMPSGDLSGPKQIGSDRSVLNARMYCHSIATLALAEARAMTGDALLRDPLLHAAQYSINAQDIRGGGWRYRPHDPGDLSQFGWQAMALKSVENSGIEVPIETKRRMRRFLDSCATGSAGGLSTYRPNEGRPSATMTAEGLACRLLLDYPTSLPAQREATTMIMGSRPGMGETNVYFWYYATLALFQLQDDQWRIWNQAMKRQLLITQVPVYRDNAGSWEPDEIWGGYGGRVYSTAMSCLCLEVYYRYLPMYQRNHLARTPRATSFNR